MNPPRTRREFFTAVGRAALVASLGPEIASGLGLASELSEESASPLTFGPLEPLVCLMQETPVERLLPVLVERLRSGTELRELVAAAAFANARTFGGEDDVGFHTMMALAPAFQMAAELPREQQPLPVFKVLYRNTSRIQACGGRKSEVLQRVKPGPPVESRCDGESLREAVRRRNVVEAEETFAALARGSAEDTFNQLLFTVQDHTEVHRVVLPYRP